MAGPSQSEIIKHYPIGNDLDSFRTLFESKRDAFVRFQKFLSRRLITALLALQAADQLPSYSTGKDLYNDLTQLLTWINSEGFDISRIQGLMDAVVGGNPDAGDEQIWNEVYRAVEPRTPHKQRPCSNVTAESSTYHAKVLAELYQSWNSPYFGDSVRALDEMLQKHEQTMKNTNREEVYGKTLIFVQSSGMGKSRLADKFGETHLMINFVLREPNTTGYPPSDPEIFEIMHTKLSEKHKKMINSSPNKTENPFPSEIGAMIWYHSLAVGLLQASFEKLHEWVKGEKKMLLEQLAAKRHKLMAPYPPNQSDKGSWDKRTTHRVKFCKSVVDRANDIAIDLIEKPKWRHAFRDAEDSQVRINLKKDNLLDDLKKIAGELKSELDRFPSRVDNPLLVIVFDEAATLLKEPGRPDLPKPGPYYALNRVISFLTTLPIWFFFLSTESHVRQLLPPDNETRTGSYVHVPSARLGVRSKELLRRFPPFLAFQLDIEDRNNMANGHMEKELARSFTEFTKPEHLAMFGRPLWHGYQTSHLVHDLARLKLVGGKTGERYNGNNVDHVFAALSFRVSLDVCLQNPRTIELTNIAVNFYMRVVISMDTETGAMYTETPSEPVLAKAAMSHLCENNWPTSISTLTKELLNKGLIEKGLKGELYARLMLILARDTVWVKAGYPESTPSFTVSEFLNALYAEDHQERLGLIPNELRDARMNLNHFTAAGENLKQEHFPRLWHELLRRNAGIQLAHNQPTYDIMIPVYFGSETGPFNPSDCGVILIQVKNKKKATTPGDMFGESFQEQESGKDHPVRSIRESSRNNQRGKHFIFNKTTHPILVLIFDLGVEIEPNSKASRVQLYKSMKNCPTIWVIHSHGHDEAVFGCLTAVGCTRTISQEFFGALKPPEKSLHYKLCKKNMLFSKLAWTHRYQIKKKSEEEKDGDESDEENGGEEDDEDVPMKDV
ncbi:hypothetical protein ARAM_007644 [Aspergillus rambellii]|uniref:Uncharacterized protein n=2 Tax=Aspergillus subgen. Nidulantes TaxID=2720870 RepID=A0A0F8WXL1_9EURO|nr:hypothetical protein AOCH_007576 [Aspergillus ochraceoroseus]KKK22260.1 hypothetical protein ARAM_007644 [Aspergillus rambellii]